MKVELINNINTDSLENLSYGDCFTVGSNLNAFFMYIENIISEDNNDIDTYRIAATLLNTESKGMIRYFEKSEEITLIKFKLVQI